jgi:hypothetical protein
LVFRVNARTVLELGSELISSDIIAFYELIKNVADAEVVIPSHGDPEMNIRARARTRVEGVST